MEEEAHELTIDGIPWGHGGSGGGNGGNDDDDDDEQQGEWKLR